MGAIDEFLKVENRCGDCSGESDGSGHGSGYGHGYISRYGCGDGSGGGSGSSIGSGYVYGNGFGGGYGNLSDIQSYCGIPAHDINGEPTIIYSVHGNIAKCAFLKQDMTLEPCYIVKSGKTYTYAKTLKEAKAIETDEKNERDR